MFYIVDQDIALFVGIVEIFSTNPRENHLMEVKRIMRYLRGRYDFGLYYKRSENFELNAYTNADWGDNIDEKKSTSGGALFLGRRLVTWTSKKKSCTSQCTVEAKYVAAAINYTNILCICW